MIWTVPNILTAGRLLAAPAIALLFLLLPRGLADWLALVVFVSASITDYLDGYLARKWNQVSKLGTMMDPIADKAMVVIALAILLSQSSLSQAIMIPATLILFREVFVSGLREFLGDVAGTLKVTKLAKWKTACQMVAIALVLVHGLFEHYLGVWTWGMDEATVTGIFSGTIDDPLGVVKVHGGWIWSGNISIVLMWIAGILTLISGIDYFRKASPYLRD